MKNLTLKQAIEDTKKIASKMPSGNWTIYNRLTELMEEVGELSNAIPKQQKDLSLKTGKNQRL